jgi:hypothetical protein
MVLKMARLPRLNLPGIHQHVVQRGNKRQVSSFVKRLSRLFR